MILGQSIAGFLATLLYLAAAVACAAAAGTATDAHRPKGEVLRWTVIAALFVSLMAMRHFGVEEHLRSILRGELFSQGEYQVRRSFQGPLAAAAVVSGASVLSWLALRDSRSVMRNRLGRILLSADIAVVALVGLIGVRMISFHAMDMLLYRGPHLNWLVDIGATCACGFAAKRYVHVLRRARLSRHDTADQ